LPPPFVELPAADAMPTDNRDRRDTLRQALHRNLSLLFHRPSPAPFAAHDRRYLATLQM
jgi:hypothetical protein